MPRASAACAIPSIACSSSQAISGFSGEPKFRQSVSASGRPPPQATFRAAPSTARTAPTNGSSSPGGGPCSDTADRKSTRLNSSHSQISYAVFCLKKKKEHTRERPRTTRLPRDRRKEGKENLLRQCKSSLLNQQSTRTPSA